MKAFNEGDGSVEAMLFDMARTSELKATDILEKAARLFREYEQAKQDARKCTHALRKLCPDQSFWPERKS